MRKFSFILILLSLAVRCWAEENIQFELYGDSQKNGGVKLKTPLMEVRTANQPEKENFGICLTGKNYFKKLPFELKYGNLSVAGSLSRLNSPELSNGTSPFSDGCLSVTGLSASLPAYTSFSNPQSSFLQLSINQLTKSPLSLSLGLWASPENDSPVFSTLISDKFFSKQLTLTASCTAGEFLYDANSSSSWFLDSPYYTSDSHFCSLFQLSADYKNKNSKKGFYTAFMAAIYESPFGPYTAVYRGDFKLSLKQSEFYTSAFLNCYEDTLTSSGKKLQPALQLKTGLLKKKPLLSRNAEPVFLKFGLNAYSKINLTDTEHPLRLNTGAQLSTEKTSLSFSVSAAALLKSESPEEPPQEFKKDSLTFQIKNSWYLKSFTPSLTLTSEIKEAVKYKIQLNLTNNAKHKISGSCAFSFKAQENEISNQKLTAGLTCRLNLKNLRVIGKMSFSSGL